MGGPVLKTDSQLVPFLESIAAGDLSGSFGVKRQDELGMLAQAANDMSGQLRGLITELQQAGLQITNSSTQVLATAEDHALGSVQQAASIAQVTSTMEELTNTAKQIAQSATSVERIADDSADAAHAGYDSVGEALESMENIRKRVADISGKILLLGERSRRISEVLNLIKEIAGEIHLLAVNAAIESAAAGEHGKRFAVVAGEVRRLAERTRDSAEEIKAIVGEIQSATHSSVLATEQGVKEVENGVALATGARGSLEQIMQMVDRTTAGDSADHARHAATAERQRADRADDARSRGRDQPGGGRNEAVRDVGGRAQVARRSVQDAHQGIQVVAPAMTNDATQRRPPRIDRQPRACPILVSFWAPSCTAAADRLREVTRLTRLRRIPGAAAHVAGLVNLRGEIICALDTHAILGLARSARPGRGFLIALRDFDFPVGLVVDSIADVFTIDPDGVLSPAGRLVAPNGPHW